MMTLMRVAVMAVAGVLFFLGRLVHHRRLDCVELQPCVRWSLCDAMAALGAMAPR
jgi:hypothetical protein